MGVDFQFRDFFYLIFSLKKGFIFLKRKVFLFLFLFLHYLIGRNKGLMRS
jgi:hypothetical protein